MDGVGLNRHHPIPRTQSKRVIYLDHAATSPLRAEAREAMLPFLDGASATRAGSTRSGAMRRRPSTPRGRRGRVPRARTSEILFTSGGTESINTATLGIAYAMHRAGAGNHIITTAIEHHAGLHVAQYLEELGFEVTTIGCDSSGRISLAEFTRALRPETVLVSVMLANNEVGTVQPIAEVAALLRDFANEAGPPHRAAHRRRAGAGWLDIDVDALGVDALSLSSHKFGGPKGSGVLYLRRATPFRPLLHGGGQEMQKRAGTENVAGHRRDGCGARSGRSGVAERSRRVRGFAGPPARRDPRRASRGRRSTAARTTASRTTSTSRSTASKATSWCGGWTSAASRSVREAPVRTRRGSPATC